MLKRHLAILILVCCPALASADYELETVATGFNFPWSITFLPDGDFLVSMRSGELRRVSAAGETGAPIDNVPATYVASQGGFFDIVLDPDFSSNNTVYLAFAHGTPEANATRVVKATLSGNALENVEPIYTVAQTKDTPAHYGGKLLFLPDGTLLVTTGDGFEYREQSQNLRSELGKIIRINADGSVPADNPFADGKAGDPKIWSYGHRSPQGLALDTATGIVYMHEHGPQGGDELNEVKRGANYGWPAVTYGINYSGAYVSPFKQADGIEDALIYWVPSIAPSGLVMYRGAAFPEWQGDAFVGALVDKEVRRVDMSDGKAVGEESLFKELDARIREVREGPDGYLYLLTDSDSGSIVRVKPAR